MIEHPAPDLLADLAADVPVEASVAEHAAGCAECKADLAALAAVTAHLAALPPVPLPSDIATRIDAALAAEARPSLPTADVVPLTSRRPRVPGWLTAAAVALVAIGGSALLVTNGVFDGLGSSDGASDSAAGRVNAPSIVLSASGTNYSAKTLLGQLGGLLTGASAAPFGAAPPRAAAGAGLSPTKAAVPAPTGVGQELDASTASKIGQLAALTDQTSLANCLAQALGADLGTPIAVDLARFDGKPAVIAAYPAELRPQRVDVYVLDPSCPVGKFVYFARLVRPTPS